MTFELPFFYNYPPYFTLQPVQETRQRQLELWTGLILSFCAHHKIYQVHVTGSDALPLFENKGIQRRLDDPARRAILDAAVQRGKAEWLDPQRNVCLILWRSVAEWAALILDFVVTYGLQGSVMTVPEISASDETMGTELQGLDIAVVTRALTHLERQGKATVFKGTGGDDDAVKFTS